MASNHSDNIWMKLLTPVLFVAMIITLYLIFLFAPTESSMGHIQRIFYFHVPMAQVSFLSFPQAVGPGSGGLLSRCLDYEEGEYPDRMGVSIGQADSYR